jgi:hypothetical protein
MKQIDLREGARRQHRSAAMFAVIQSWLRGLDGLVFNRTHLERLIGLERFKKRRVEWLQEDLRDFFPYQISSWAANKKDTEGELNSFSSLWAARKPIEPFIPKEDMTLEARLSQMPDDGPKLAMFKIWPGSPTEDIRRIFEGAIPFFADSANFDERLLTSYLALLCQGQISPRALPSLRETD